MEDPYYIEGTRLTESYLKDMVYAKMTIDKNFERFKDVGDFSCSFHWLRYKISFPNFDDLAFCYRNQVFSVLLTALEIGNINPKRYERFIINCQRYQLYPCFFIMNPKTHQPLYTPWCLVSKQGKRLRPELMTTSALIPMSDYEIYVYMVTLVLSELKKMHFKINNYNFWPANDPQIWFYDHQNRLCWMLVRRSENIRNKEDYKKYIGYERFYPQLSMYDGYFASVFVGPKLLLNNPERIVYRDNDFGLYYEGMHRIYIYDWDQN